jgi:hypothetical protein
LLILRRGKRLCRRGRPHGQGRVVTGEANGERLPAAIARHYLKFDFHPRDKPARIPVEYRSVQEDIFAAVIGGDESIAAALIELQHPARSQLGLTSYPVPITTHVIITVEPAGITRLATAR